MRLAELTTKELAALFAAGPVVALLPVGSTEPHGPHLPLATDTYISEEAAQRAVPRLAAQGISAVVAPSLPYGVTDYAGGFAGAVGVSAAVLTAMLTDLGSRLLREGFAHVCLVNNHLEPAHDAAVRAAASACPPGTVSVACPLTRRWGRTLSEEFRRGNCHAGRYETSLVLARAAASASAGDVRAEYMDMRPLDVSLADGIRAGKRTFLELGMDEAYTGAPALATRAEGDELYALLAEMIVVEVTEALAGGAASASA
ncbi:MAG: creatininase family protein [Myxococcales bacterium]|nr:creatininase family protein [Myxococcales bacterium]MBL0196280.1 creatininase family protein [Myxococcales bacterium]